MPGYYYVAAVQCGKYKFTALGSGQGKKFIKIKEIIHANKVCRGGS